MKCHFSTCGRKVNVTVVSLLLPRCHAQEPTRVELGEGADQQGTVWLLVMSKEKLESAWKEDNLGAGLWLHHSWATFSLIGSRAGPIDQSSPQHFHSPTPAFMYTMLLSGSVSPDLLVDRGTPSLLHSTETVEDGGGLTLQGSTTVWPTKASTVDGSSLWMVTPPTVKLKTGQMRGEEEGGRIERRAIEESITVTLCSTVGTLISCHQGKHKEFPQPGAGDLSESLESDRDGTS